MRRVNIHIAAVTAIATLSTFCSTSMFATEDDTERYATVQITTSMDSARTGQLIELVVNFSTEKDIHITSEPALEFTLRNTPWLRRHGKLIQTVDTANGYLITSSPARQKFLISKNAPLGKQKIEVNIVYYLCSDPEGWCRKFQEAISLGITVTR